MILNLTSIEVDLLIHGLATGLYYPPNGDYSTKYHIGASVEHSTHFTYLNGNLVDIQLSNWSTNYFISSSDIGYSISQLSENASFSQVNQNTHTFEADWIFEPHFYLLIIVTSYLISNKRKIDDFDDP